MTENLRQTTVISGVQTVTVEADVGDHGKHLPTATIEIGSWETGHQFKMQIVELTAIQLWTLQQMIEQLFGQKVFHAETKKQDWAQRLSEYQKDVGFQI